MPESEHSQQNLASILTRLGNVESMLRFTVAASSDVKEHVKTALTARDGAAEFYLLLKDGPRNQEQLRQESGKSQPTVSRVLTYLSQCGLIAKDPIPGGGAAWRWSDVEEVLGVARIAQQIVRESTKGKN